MNPWWTAYQGNQFGGWGGAAMGVICGCIGAAAGYLAPRGKAKAFVFASFAVMIALGVVCLVVGLFALSTGQPWHVWYPLLLIGVIDCIVVPIQIPALRTRYRQAELRRLEAEELRRA